MPNLALTEECGGYRGTKLENLVNIAVFRPA